MDGCYPDFPHLLDRHRHQVHHHVDLSLAQPALRNLPLLQVIMQITLIAVLSYEDRLLPEFIEVLELDYEFTALLTIVELHGAQLFIIGLNFAGFSLKNFYLRTVNSHHLFVLGAEGQVAILRVVVVIFDEHFGGPIDEVLLNEWLRQ